MTVAIRRASNENTDEPREPPMPDPVPTELIDEDARLAFEKAWLAGSLVPIESLLPPPVSASYLPTLEELAHIDLEFRWKEFLLAIPDGPRPPERRRVEDYLRQFPRLDEPATVLRLAEQE
jgi:hypothetical protein